MRRVLVVGAVLVALGGCEPAPEATRLVHRIDFGIVEIGSRAEGTTIAAEVDGHVGPTVTGPFELVSYFRAEPNRVGVTLAFAPATIGDQQGELILSTAAGPLRIAISGRGVACAPKDACHATDPSTGACVAANQGASCGTDGICSAGTCIPRPPEAERCLSPCGFEGTMTDAGCQLGTKPAPFRVEGATHHMGGYGERFTHFSGDSFIGHRTYPANAYDPHSFRLIQPSGVIRGLFSTSYFGFTQLIAGNLMVVLTHPARTDWKLETFELTFGGKVYEMSGYKSAGGSVDPFVSGGRLVLGEHSPHVPNWHETRAYDLATGAPRWTRPGYAIVVGEEVACLRMDHTEHRHQCVDLAGALLYEMPPGSVPIAEQRGVVVFATRQGASAQSLEGRSRTGELLWSRPPVTVTTGYTLRHVAQHEGVLYFGDGTRLRIADGQPLPPLHLKTGADTLTFAGARAYTIGDQLCAVDLVSGAAGWCLPQTADYFGSVSERPDGVRYTALVWGTYSPPNVNGSLHLCHVGRDGKPISAVVYPGIFKGSAAFGDNLAIVGTDSWDGTYTPEAWTSRAELIPLPE